MSTIATTTGGRRSPTARSARSRLVVVLVVAVALVACGGSQKGAARPDRSGCPDVSKADAVEAFDFAKAYGLSRGAGDQLKAALLTGIDLGFLAEKLDADLGIACAGLAKELGRTGDWRTSNDVCAAALAGLQEAKAKQGRHLVLVTPDAACTNDPLLVTKCASRCDSSASAEKAQSECLQRSGRCEGVCTGSCRGAIGAKCDGICMGSCEGPFKGACSGRCVGTCDGKRSTGPCAGICAGACDRGTARGECTGTCTGTCALAKPGRCAGTCSGACSVELLDAKCATDFAVPAVIEDCQTRCGLSAIAHRECSAPAAGIVVGAKSHEGDDALKGALERFLPAILKVAHEIGENGAGSLEAAAGLVDRAHQSLDAGRSGRALTTCFEPPLKTAAESAKVATNAVRQAFALRDEASK